MIHLSYQTKANRDAKFKELKAQGHDVRKTSIRNQLTHPQYVEDFEGEEKFDTGFDNTVYKTYFSVLYGIETTPKWLKEIREERKELKKLMKEMAA